MKLPAINENAAKIEGMRGKWSEYYRTTKFNGENPNSVGIVHLLNTENLSKASEQLFECGSTPVEQPYKVANKDSHAKGGGEGII